MALTFTGIEARTQYASGRQLRASQLNESFRQPMYLTNTLAQALGSFYTGTANVNINGEEATVEHLKNLFKLSFRDILKEYVGTAYSKILLEKTVNNNEVPTVEMEVYNGESGSASKTSLFKIESNKITLSSEIFENDLVSYGNNKILPKTSTIDLGDTTYKFNNMYGVNGYLNSLSIKRTNGINILNVPNDGSTITTNSPWEFSGSVSIGSPSTAVNDVDIYASNGITLCDSSSSSQIQLQSINSSILIEAYEDIKIESLVNKLELESSYGASRIVSENQKSKNQLMSNYIELYYSNGSDIFIYEMAQDKVIKDQPGANPTCVWKTSQNIPIGLVEKINDMATNIGNNNTSISSINTSIGNIDTSIGNINTNIVGLDVRVATLEIWKTNTNSKFTVHSEYTTVSDFCRNYLYNDNYIILRATYYIPNKNKTYTLLFGTETNGQGLSFAHYIDDNHDIKLVYGTDYVTFHYLKIN